MTETDNFVHFDAISKSYDGQSLVVNNLDLTIRKGEFLTLLGPSGSGKTTCLMMLAGFESPSAGEIHFAGKRIDAVPAYKRNIGMVFQNYALFPHMTLLQNVGFPLRQRGHAKSEIAGRAGRALDMVQLGHLADRLPSQLSGGQQQRVALARAMVFEPHLILMDEPLGALDRRLREHMQIEIKELHQRIGTTIVYVTHDQSEALTMSDRVAVFNRGRIEQIARPEDVYERPSTLFVANFMGENNALSTEVLSSEGDIRKLRLEDGSVVSGLAVGALSAGNQATLAIRPERIRLGDLAGPESVQCEVRSLVYNGDHLIVPCRLASGTALQLKVMMGAPGIETLRQGEKIRIGWTPEDARVFCK